MKYIDVTRYTETDLDEFAVRMIRDIWVTERDRDLGSHWVGKTVFNIRKTEPPDGQMWAGEELIRKEALYTASESVDVPKAAKGLYRTLYNSAKSQGVP